MSGDVLHQPGKGRDLLRQGVVRARKVHIPPEGLRIGQCRLIIKDDGDGNLDFFLQRPDGSESNLTIGGSGGAPADGQYLTLAYDGDLGAERLFTPGTALAGTDGGANSAYTLNHDQVNSGDLHQDYLLASGGRALTNDWDTFAYDIGVDKLYLGSRTSNDVVLHSLGSGAGLAVGRGDSPFTTMPLWVSQGNISEHSVYASQGSSDPAMGSGAILYALTSGTDVELWILEYDGSTGRKVGPIGHSLYETSGPTNLVAAAIPDGEFVKRSGTTLIGRTTTEVRTDIDFVAQAIAAVESEATLEFDAATVISTAAGDLTLTPTGEIVLGTDIKVGNFDIYGGATGSAFGLFGGTKAAGTGAIFFLWGSDLGEPFKIYTPNAAKDANVLRLAITGNQDAGSGAITLYEPLAVDVINEKTGAAGVTIDSVLLKDGEVDGVVVDAHAVRHTDGSDNIQDAAADDSTKGIATFEADDFDDASGKIDLAVSVAKSAPTDSGTATPSSHDLTIAGGEGIDTSGAGSTVTITGEDASDTNKGIVELATTAETTTGTDAGRAVTPDGLKDGYQGSANVTTVGALASGSLAAGFTDVPVAQGGTGASTLTDHGVMLGSGTGAVSVVSPVAGPSATAGFQYLRSPDASTDGAYKEVMREKTFVIEDPADADSIVLGFFFQAVTIREVQTAVVGTSAVWNMYHSTNRGTAVASGDKLFQNDQTSNSTDTLNHATFGTGDQTLVADSWLVIDFGTVTACTELDVSVRYTID